MIDYAKTVLSKVSFDKDLFKKELRKFLQHTTDDDQRSELKNWVRGNFNKQHPDAINDVFQQCGRQVL